MRAPSLTSTTEITWFGPTGTAKSVFMPPGGPADSGNVPASTVRYPLTWERGKPLENEEPPGPRTSRTGAGGAALITRTLARPAGGAVRSSVKTDSARLSPAPVAASVYDDPETAFSAELTTGLAASFARTATT